MLGFYGNIMHVWLHIHISHFLLCALARLVEHFVFTHMKNQNGVCAAHSSMLR